MIWSLCPGQCQDWLDLKAEWHQGHLTTWLGGSVGALSCWSADLRVTWYAQLLPNISLSLYHCSANSHYSLNKNTLLQLQSGQRAWLQLIKVLCGWGGRKGRKFSKCSEDLEQLYNFENRPENMSINNLLWIANYQQLVIILKPDSWQRREKQKSCTPIPNCQLNIYEVHSYDSEGEHISLFLFCSYVCIQISWAIITEFNQE